MKRLICILLLLSLTLSRCSCGEAKQISIWQSNTDNTT